MMIIIKVITMKIMIKTIAITIMLIIIIVLSFVEYHLNYTLKFKMNQVAVSSATYVLESFLLSHSLLYYFMVYALCLFGTLY